jgi:hypothetical protein
MPSVERRSVFALARYGIPPPPRHRGNDLLVTAGPQPLQTGISGPTPQLWARRYVMGGLDGGQEKVLNPIRRKFNYTLYITMI